MGDLKSRSDDDGVYMPLSGCTIYRAKSQDTAPEVDRVLKWSAKFPQPAQKSVEWRNQRAYYCTASQHAACLGRCKYKSRNESLRQYAGVIRNTFTGNAATRHGERYEDEAVEKYKRLRGVQVCHFGMLPFYEEADWLGGSPDGISLDGCLIEVKCPYRRKPNGTVPAHYMPQIQSMMHGLDLRLCHFIEYVPACILHEEIFDIIEVQRDETYWRVALPLLRVFWDEVNVLRSTVTEDICYDDGTSNDSKEKKKRRATPPPPRPQTCSIVYTRPKKTKTLYTGEDLPLNFMATFCVQGLGGGANNNDGDKEDGARAAQPASSSSESGLRLSSDSNDEQILASSSL